ncbi:MAG: hypothetical protein KBB55_00495 [Candidatus Buchananbacteria bacterium]|nr:hypothetical protein [Candidatus Buchananbacteria bacterium]
MARTFSDAGAPSTSAKTNKIIIGVIVVVLAVLVGGYLLDRYTQLPLPFGADETSSDWQAVFLSNGQVYFGKVASQKGDRLILRDIYYLQVVTKPLQRTAEGQAASGDQQQQELTLIKLGNELHGPTDKMTINRDHVLLTEALRNDSRVVQAINQYVKDQQNQPQGQAAGTVPAGQTPPAAPAAQ